MQTIYPKKEFRDVLKFCYKQSLKKRLNLLLVYTYIYDDWEKVPIDIKSQFDCLSKESFLENFLSPLCDAVDEIKQKLLNIEQGFIIID